MVVGRKSYVHGNSIGEKTDSDFVDVVLKAGSDDQAVGRRGGLIARYEGRWRVILCM